MINEFAFSFSDNFEVVSLEKTRNFSLDTLDVTVFSVETVRTFPSWINVVATKEM